MKYKKKIFKYKYHISINIVKICNVNITNFLAYLLHIFTIFTAYYIMVYLDTF
jgi:hypothetical protein